MDNAEYQKTRRKTRKKIGWKYFSVQVPAEFYIELRKFYLRWKLENINNQH